MTGSLDSDPTNETYYNLLQLQASAYVQTAADIGVELNGSAAYTVDAWVKFGGLGTGTSILSKEGMFKLGIEGHTVVVEMQSFPTTRSIASMASIGTEDWHFISAVFSGTGMRIYIDGRLASSPTIIRGTPVTNSNPYMIGQNLQGLVNLVRVKGGAVGSKVVLSSMFQPPAPTTYDAYFDFTRFPPVDTSGNNRTVTLEDGARSLQYVNGVFLADTAYCQPVRDESVNPGGAKTDPYTIQAWVYPNYARPASQIVFINGDSESDGGVGLYLAYNPSTTDFSVVSLRGAMSGGTPLTSTSTIGLNEWNNIATTYDGTTLNIYINGVLDKSAAAVSIGALAEGDPLIGANLVAGRPSGDMSFQGYIEKVDAWNKCLAAADIVTYMSTSPILQSGLPAHYTFYEPPARNEYNGNPVGLTDGARLEPQVSKATNDAPEIALDELDELPADLDAAVMSSLRDAVDQASLFAGDPDILERLRDADIDGIADLFTSPAAAQRAEADLRREWDENIDIHKNRPQDASWTITHHEIDGEWVILRHEDGESEVLFRESTETIDECTVWKLRLIWTIVMGLMSIFGFTAQITDKIKNYINVNYLANTTLMEKLWSMVDTGTAIGLYYGLNLLQAHGLLWPLIKMIASYLGYWVVFEVLKKIALIFVGAAVATTIARLVVAAIQLYRAVKAQPDGCTWSSAPALPEHATS